MWCVCCNGFCDCMLYCVGGMKNKNGMEKEVNLEEIFMGTSLCRRITDRDDIEVIKIIAKEACRQVLELASENARIKYYYHGSGVDYAEIQNDSITNTINQVV